MVSINIKKLTPEKDNILSEICKETKCDVYYTYETHRTKHHNRLKVGGMKLIVNRSHYKHCKYRSAIFVRSDTYVVSIDVTENKNIELLEVNLEKNIITSTYKPPFTDFKFTKTNNFRSKETQFVIDDFNSHSVYWGYYETDENGTTVEDWAETNQLILDYNFKLPTCFNGERLRRGYHPDNIFASDKIANLCEKSNTKTNT